MLMWEKVRQAFSRRTLGTAAARGALGERLAEEFLRRKGYRIVAVNWRSPRDQRDELDLICRDGEALVFVEVKARRAAALVSGYYTVGARKKKVLRRAADAFLHGLALTERPKTFRLDVVEIRFAAEHGTDEVRHFENVPLFPKYYAP